jgi:hypothetical protein
MYCNCLYNLEAFVHQNFTIAPPNCFFRYVKPVQNGTYIGIMYYVLCIMYYMLA